MYHIKDEASSTSERGVPSGETNSRTGVLQPCFVCSDRNNSKEIVKYSMATCTIWNRLSLEQKRAMVNFIKHPFAKDNQKSIDCKKGIGICRHCSEFNEHHFLLCQEKVFKEGMANMGCPLGDPGGRSKNRLSGPGKVGQLIILRMTILPLVVFLIKSRRKYVGRDCIPFLEKKMTPKRRKIIKLL